MTPANQAIEEIKAVLSKHDLAGMVMVQAPKESAFLNVIDPSWSVAKYEETREGTAIRIRAKAEHFPSRAAQKEAVEWTCGMVIGFMLQAERTREQFEQIAGVLGQHFGITYAEGRNT